MPAGILLESLTWKQAEEVLTADTVVCIALGAAAKEHGLHLKLNNDYVLASYLQQQVVAQAPVVVAPPITYSYYPAFVEYPGSITLSMETASAMVVEICQSLAAFGPRRFYIINTGISTLKPLAAAAESLLAKGIILKYTNLETAAARAIRDVSEQEGGTHADEIETSVMLYIAPDSVNMDDAVRDYNRFGTGALTRTQQGKRAYSPSGVWGDPTLATVQKGKTVVESLVAAILQEIEELRKTPTP